MICVLTGGTGGAKFGRWSAASDPGGRNHSRRQYGRRLVMVGTVRFSGHRFHHLRSLRPAQPRARLGREGRYFSCLQAMGQLGEPTWFHTGDRDLAVHLLRSRLLAEGKTLSEATSTICDKLGVKARILPMSNSRVETRVDTPSGELSFEEYFVQRWYQDPVNSVAFRRSFRRRGRARSNRSYRLCRRCAHRSEQSHHQHRPDTCRAGNARRAGPSSRQSSGG